jgi:hypothetical protein
MIKADLRDASELLASVVDEHRRFETSTYCRESLLPRPIADTEFFARSVNHEFDTIRAASDGGLFAVIHKSRAESLMQTINLYDSCLNHTSVLTGSGGANIKNFYVTPEELIIVIYEDTVLTAFDQRNHAVFSKKLVNQRMALCVTAAFYETGLFFMTFTGQVYHLSDFIGMEPQLFAELPPELSNGTKSFTAVPAIENSHGPIVWAYCKTSTELLVCIQQDNFQQVDFQDEIRQISFSADYQIALVLFADSILICSPTFDRGYARINFNDWTIRQAVWCGSSSVLVTTPNKLIMVGDSMRTLEWDTPDGAWVSTEIDGARVITKNEVWLIREVTGVPLEFIDRTADSAALRFFLKVGNPVTVAKRDPIPKLLPSLAEAIHGCLEAAKFFRKPELVRTLLEMVAQYHPRLTDYDSTAYSTVLNQVRVVTFLACPPLNMPMTVGQFEHLGNDRLLFRLCNRYLHLHAFKMADHLGGKTDVIYSHWAHCLLRSNASTGEVITKLTGNKANVDYVDLATLAFDLAESAKDPAEAAEKRALASALLELNKVKARSVPLLIRREQWSDAVEAAVNSNDMSLLVYVLKVASEKNQDEIVRKCLSRHAIAIEGWFKLHPEEPDRAQLLAQSGFKRDSLFVRFMAGEDLSVLRAEAKQAKDDLSVALFDGHAQLLKAAGSLGVEFTPEMTAYQLFDIAVEAGKSPESVARLLGFEKDELLSQTVAFAVRTGNREMLLEACSKPKPPELLDVVLDLAEKGKIDEARAVRELLVDPALVEVAEGGIEKALERAHT